jgi:hypothetical protein
MTAPERDPSLDSLLDLDGQILFVNEAGRYSVKFLVRRTDVTPERPHGLSYSLTLHGPHGERLVGFDNAHAVTAGRGRGRSRRRAHDHKHRLRTVRAYDYRDAATLLGDFWAEVDAVLREKGVLR